MSMRRSTMITIKIIIIIRASPSWAPPSTGSIIAHANRLPAFPVLLLSSSLPVPRSSSPSWITRVRPIMVFVPNNVESEPLGISMSISAVPSESASMLPKSPACLSPEIWLPWTDCKTNLNLNFQRNTEVTTCIFENKPGGYFFPTFSWAYFRECFFFQIWKKKCKRSLK